MCAKNPFEGHTGETHNLEICTDRSSAAMSMRYVPGGRVRHLEVPTMWVPQIFDEEILGVLKVVFPAKNVKQT